MNARQRVEQAAIATAESYVHANGAPRVAAGLMLAGMVIGASLEQPARRLLVDGYLEQHPDAAESMGRWTILLDRSAES